METMRKIIANISMFVVLGALATAAAFVCTAIVDAFVFSMGLFNTIFLLTAIFSVLSYKLMKNEEK